MIHYPRAVLYDYSRSTIILKKKDYIDNVSFVDVQVVFERVHDERKSRVGLAVEFLKTGQLHKKIT